MKSRVVLMVLVMALLGVVSVFLTAPLTKATEVLEPTESAEELVVTKWGALSKPFGKVRGLIELYEQWSGKEVGGDPEILKREIYLVLQGPFTKEEGVRFLEMTLKLNGLDIVEDDGQLAISQVPFELADEQRVAAKTLPNFQGASADELVLTRTSSMNMPGITGGMAMAVFSQHSGRRVMQSTIVALSDFSINVNGPATSEEVATQIWKSFHEAGYGFVEAPGDLSTLWLVVADEKRVAEFRGKRVERGGKRIRYIPKSKSRRTRYVPRPR